MIKYKIQIQQELIILINEDFLQQRIIKCIGKNNKTKLQNFVKSSKTNTPIPRAGATNLTPIGESFMYFETSADDYGRNVFFLVFNEQSLYN